MTIRSRVAFVALVALMSCSGGDSKPTDEDFEKYIRFNHLYVVIDSVTYDLLSNSNQFLADFSGVVETQSDTKDETWAGKYMYGKGHYLEIFRPGGYPGSRPGDVGLGFMPTRTGTLDSLHKHWSKTADSVDRKERTIVDGGVTYPWFTSLSIRDRDSLQLRVFLMENAKEDMLYWGFTEEDLQNEITYWDYMRYYRAHVRETSPDSIQFNKLFEKVTAIHLTLSYPELTHLTQHLKDFGFQKEGNIFHGNDIDIEYAIDEDTHLILNGIDFKLTDSLAEADYRLNKLRITVKGREATFRLR